MHFLQVIGPIFILVHSVSIFFMKRLSYAKRISLVVMMALLVISTPYLYSFSPLVLGITVLLTLALYGYLLLFHGSSVYDDFETDGEFENIAINRPVALQEVEINSPTSAIPASAPVSYSAASEFDTVADLTQTASYSANLVTDESSPTIAYGQVSTESTDMTRESESALLSDMLKKLEQIDSLLTHEEEAKVNEPNSIEVESTIETAAPASVATEVESNPTSSSLEQMLSADTVSNPEIDDKMAGKTLAKDINPEDVPVLTQAEEEELLDEIEHIIASQVETQGVQSNSTSEQLDDHSLVVNTDNTVLSATGDDVFTLKPVDEQTLEKIKEKQEEDGLLSVEDQLDKELYFQFLLYESKELLMMGMYQETVDYLKEILIDSYDKNLRRSALEILESVKVELYHPQLTGNMNQEYKYLEERKVL